MKCIPSFQLNMYFTNNEVQDNYCLYYHAYAKDNLEYFLQHYLHTYCFRSDEYFKINSSNDQSFILFSELREQKITSEQLYFWSTSIDIIERYEMYLMNINQNNSQMDSERFYNCTRSSFGPFCQFKLDIFGKSLHEIIYNSIELPLSIYEIIESLQLKEPASCYVHLNCDYIYSLPMCFTWRDICDGKIDCLNNGIDEKDCFELELNQCDEMKEFRCHNGQCIPLEFLNDNSQFPDCLDRSDEPFHTSLSCYKEPSMRCEDHRCELGSINTNCGDGDCHDSNCPNGQTQRWRISLTSKPNSLSPDEPCWKIINRLSYIYSSWEDVTFMNFFDKKEKIKEIRQYCPLIFLHPPYPIALGHIYYVYTKNQSYTFEYSLFALPTYICYNETLCPSLHLFSQFPRSIYLSINSNKNFTCHELKSLSMIDISKVIEWYQLRYIIEDIYSSACLSISQIFQNIDNNCQNYSQLYQCQNSRKCISKYRILDGIIDCPMGDDETYENSCSLTKIHHRFRYLINGTLKCVSPILYFNEKYSFFNEISNNPLISFQTLCDGFIERVPLILTNETDETNCDYTIWPCNNTYTHCDSYWNCPKGEDELDCPSLFEKDDLCEKFQHICISPYTYDLKCIDLDKINDNFVDCLGGTDERQLCRTISSETTSRYHCFQEDICISIYQLCDRENDCLHDDDEKMCREATGIPQFTLDYPLLCLSTVIKDYPIAKILCTLDESNKPSVLHFSLKGFEFYPTTISTKDLNDELFESKNLMKFEDTTRIIGLYRRYCHRGLPIQVRSKSRDDDIREECLCPPAYYGSRCQYENQRIALTIQFQIESEWRTIFSLIILLIDNDNLIHSYEKLSYLSIRDCRAKFHIYLLYNSRPKNRTKKYFIRIHSFRGDSLEYRSSWLYPIQFSYLPVHRLSFLLKIPRISNKEKCFLPCGLHGECKTYENNRISFCLCHSGWTGRNCDVQYECPCANDSFCIESPKICLCLLDKFGNRCYLKQSICEKERSPCLNNGTCISHDRRFTGYIKLFQCLCPSDFFGDLCQYKKSFIELSNFREMSSVSNLLSAHFIIANGQNPLEILTTIVKIRFDRPYLNLYPPKEFHILIIEILNEYYLMSILPNFQYFNEIKLSLKTSQRCLNIKELFNKTIIEYHPLRRAKFYHLACREHVDLKCFHDFDTFMCLCTNDHHANCFNFNFSSNHRCQNENHCLNQGQCFQDHIHCPTISICSCIGCFYGTLCQFSSESVRLSLDSILGYHIRSDTSIYHQPQIIQISFFIVLLIFILGIISGSFSIIVFAFSSTARENSCGIYLLTLSIMNLCIVNAFLIKFLLLFFIQNGSIVQLWILKGNCLFSDYILRILVNIADWLNSCIAIERTVMVIMKIKFNSKKSKKISKWIILLIVLISLITSIQDPLNRSLIYVEEDDKTWCISRLNSKKFLQQIDSILHLIHFIVPFLINLISSILIIFLTTRIRFSISRDKFNENLRKQLRHHYHLIISPCLLILLSTPRIIIVLRNNCIKSVNNPLFPLLGYFVSFVSPALVFIIYILPSIQYRNDFKEIMKRIIIIIRLRC